MALQSNLSLYCAQVTPTGVNGSVMEYSQQVESLHFTIVAPGGYGHCTCTLKVADARLPHPELALFSRVAILSKTRCIWLGEITNVEQDLVSSSADGERLLVTALGVGNGLRDDPQNLSYVGQTAGQIIADQLSRRSTYNMPISQDTSAILPQNPATTYSAAYANNTAEEVISAVATYDGDNYWGVVAHPLASQPNGTAYQDAAGFPLGQVQLHARDKTTTHYIASTLLQEVTDHSITPSADRCYNVIAIGFNDLALSIAGEATATDTRLAGGAQGTAPFRRRKYVRDLSSISTVNQAAAQAIANSYLAQMQSVTNKIQIKLVGARDYATGRALDPWDLVADRNILIPELTVRGQTLPSVPTAGVNQFYIVSMDYAEDQSGNAIVTLDCDNYTDDANIAIAQLQLQADEQARSQRTTGLVQAVGAADKGAVGMKYVASGATDIRCIGVSFHAVMVNTPSSITLAARASSNVAGVTAARISIYGFEFQVTPTAAGTCEWWGDWTTVGN